jgi:predicted ATPase
MADVTAVCVLLRQGDVRLLTLTGPPGIGKTRLSLAVAEELRDAFADGVHIVPLAPLSDPALVIPAIAQVLGVVERAGISLHDRLSAALRDRHLLLVLDNVEHLLAAAPELAALLASAPQLSLLATCRIALQLLGEQRSSCRRCSSRASIKITPALRAPLPSNSSCSGHRRWCRPLR